jgi:hypothetical protein
MESLFFENKQIANVGSQQIREKKSRSVAQEKSRGSDYDQDPSPIRQKI